MRVYHLAITRKHREWMIYDLCFIIDDLFAVGHRVETLSEDTTYLTLANKRIGVYRTDQTEDRSRLIRTSNRRYHFHRLLVIAALRIEERTS